MTVPHFPQEVLHIRNDLQKSDTDAETTTKEEQEQAFDNIVEWCASKQLFMGGNVLNAVVYSPFGPIVDSDRLQLRGLLTSIPGVSECSMRLCWISVLHSAAGKAACLEAISEAQSYLAGKMASCAEALTGLYQTDLLNWHAWVDPDGTELILAHRPLEIGLTIGRIDGQPVPEFARFAGRTIALTNAQVFIADWLGLH